MEEDEERSKKRDSGTKVKLQPEGSSLPLAQAPHRLIHSNRCAAIANATH